MPMIEIYPMTFEPVFKGYIWGGRNLETLYGRKLPEGIVAESWDISAFPGATTRVDMGYWKWRTLEDVAGDLGGHLLGTAVRERSGIRFPLLVKLLDAQRDLSVQVHPDDAYAAKHEDGALGKSEMWYVLHAQPGAELILGLAPGVTRAGFEAALKNGGLAEQLQRIPVHAGDVLNIPAGTIHALLAGVVVAEIQQNSDTTYRVYDWGRLGADGQPRPLHIAKALDVIAWDAPQARPVSPQLVAEAQGCTQELLVDSPLFTVERISLAPDAAYQNKCDGTTFQIIGCIVGAGKLAWSGAPLALQAVRFALLPAIMGDYRIQSTTESVWLRAYIH
ncbi:MAG: class I mannose-6-phosphate isomerase [Chloroflexi bacterium]|nr:class I mannose-6-phosphate isomerase [Chloroflexota bacterium]